MPYAIVTDTCLHANCVKAYLLIDILNVSLEIYRHQTDKQTANVTFSPKRMLTL